MTYRQHLIKNSSSRLGTYLLAIGTCLIYFNPLNINNEVFPYFLVAVFFLNFSLRVFIIGSMLLVAALAWLIYDPNARSFIDAANLILMLVGCGMFAKLERPNKLLVIKIFSTFLVFNCFICILQFVSADFQSFTNTFFSAEYRASVLDSVRARNGGVTGFGPEPAYTATLIVGLAMIVSAYKPKNLFIIFIVLLSLILLRSVSGFFYGFIYLSFVLSRQGTHALYQVGRASLAIIPLAVIFFYINFNQYDWIRFGEISDRMIKFFLIFMESGSLLQAEEQFGSNRLIGVYYGFSKLHFTSYETGFSPAAALNFLTGTALTSVIISLFLLLKRGRGFSYLPCLLFVIICGPKLMWPVFYFGLFGTENIKEVKIDEN